MPKILVTTYKGNQSIDTWLISFVWGLVFVFAQEPTWSNNFHDWNYKCAEFISPTNENLPYMFNWTGLSYDEATTLDRVKTKKCSFIVSKHDAKDGTLYEFRNNLVDMILKFYKILLYGF